MSTHDPRHIRRSARRRRAARSVQARRRAGLRRVAGRRPKRQTSQFVWPAVVLIAQVAVALIQLIGAVFRLLAP